MIYTILWILWGLSFFIVEGFALKNDMPGDTLSEHLRKWFRVDTRPGRTAWLVTFGGFAAWFFVHIFNTSGLV